MATSNGSLRVGFERAMRDAYETLTAGVTPNPLDVPFRTMKDVFMLAACRGYQLGERLELQAPKETPIHWDVFSSAVDIPILNAIAIATTGDVSVLARPDEIVTIAEEYANAGIRDIKETLLDQPGQRLWNLVNLVRQQDLLSL